MQLEPNSWRNKVLKNSVVDNAIKQKRKEKENAIFLPHGCIYIFNLALLDDRIIMKKMVHFDIRTCFFLPKAV